jgi:ABC-2 type transport system ATP-binding protein
LGVLVPGFCAVVIAQPVLQAKGLSRAFGEFQALKATDLELNAGETVVLTGPNGAGKSTLLLCLSGLLRPSAGVVLVEGHDLYQEERQAKQRLAFVPDVPHFYQELTTLEHVRFISLAFGVEKGWEWRAESELTELGLWEYRNMYPHNLSRGMRLKLGIALALIRPFRVLMMDEPTSALDLESTTHLVDKLLSLKKEGCAIFITSHDKSLVEGLQGRHWRMDHGRVEADE